MTELTVENPEIPTEYVQGNISTVFAYVSDITEPGQRAKRYRAIGGMLGLGFIIGPAVGGFAAQWGLEAPMFIAAALSFINLVWAYFRCRKL